MYYYAKYLINKRDLKKQLLRSRWIQKDYQLISWRIKFGENKAKKEEKIYKTNGAANRETSGKKNYR